MIPRVPTPGEILARAAAAGWPRAISDGVTIDGEDRWRRRVEGALPFHLLQLGAQLPDAAPAVDAERDRRPAPPAERADGPLMPPLTDATMLELTAAAFEWPRVALPDGRVLDSEAAWKSAIDAAHRTGDLLAVWRALQGRA